MGQSRRRGKRRWGIVMAVSVAVAVAAAVLVGNYLTPNCQREGCPAVDRLQSYRPPEPARVYDADGQLAGQLSGPRRIVVPLDSIPPILQKGYVAVEDRRFYEHGGVDLQGAVRAFFANLGSGGVEEGASTITMQLARNVFGDEVLSYNRWHRKATEIRLAREIESQLSKQRILELYLNQIYLGDGVYGVETAAQHYFGVPASDLSLTQAALLIGLAKNPEGYNPRRNPDQARERIGVVLDLLRKQGVVSAAEADEARNAKLGLKDDGDTSAWGANAYFIAGVRRELRALYPDPVERRGLRVYTGLDQDAQKAAVKDLDSQIHAIEAGRWGTFRHKTPGDSLAPAEGTSPYLQGMVVAMEPSTGLVTTLVGGRDYHHSEFDRAFQARRQPGSAFKPIVYAAALSRGLRLNQTVSTDPVRYASQGSPDWEPHDHVSGKELTVRDALVFSSNTAAVRVGQRVGVDAVIHQARAMGITTDIPHYPSIYLGAASVIPAQLVAAYASLENGGRRVEPHLIQRIEDAQGQEVWRYQATEGGRALDPRVAFLVLDVLRDVARRGTGWRVGRTVSYPVAGKTGTTNDSKDAWFVGMTPKLAAGVWIGFDDPKTVVSGGSGGTLAAPAFAAFMETANADRAPMRPWSPPPGVVQEQVDSESGLLWNRFCQGDPVDEYFLSGTDPIGECRPDEPYWYRSADGGWSYDSAAAAWSWPGESGRDGYGWDGQEHQPDRPSWGHGGDRGYGVDSAGMPAEASPRPSDVLGRDRTDGTTPPETRDPDADRRAPERGRDLDAARRNRGRIHPAEPEARVGPETGADPEPTAPPPAAVDSARSRRPPTKQDTAPASQPPPPAMPRVTQPSIPDTALPRDTTRGG